MGGTLSSEEGGVRSLGIWKGLERGGEGEGGGREEAGRSKSNNCQAREWGGPGAILAAKLCKKLIIEERKKSGSFFAFASAILAVLPSYHSIFFQTK